MEKIKKLGKRHPGEEPNLHLCRQFLDCKPLHHSYQLINLITINNDSRMFMPVSIMIAEKAKINAYRSRQISRIEEKACVVWDEI